MFRRREGQDEIGGMKLVVVGEGRGGVDRILCFLFKF